MRGLPSKVCSVCCVRPRGGGYGLVGWALDSAALGDRCESSTLSGLYDLDVECEELMKKRIVKKQAAIIRAFRNVSIVLNREGDNLRDLYEYGGLVECRFMTELGQVGQDREEFEAGGVGWSYIQGVEFTRKV
jgi:hypothetical protein